MVTGGYGADGYLDSTEIHSGSGWTIVGKLPFNGNNMKAATINNRVLLFGNILKV